VLRMALTARGGERPLRLGPLDRAVEQRILDVCPGVRVHAPAAQHPDRMWGQALRIARCHAGDAQIRHEAASGGTLTALSLHLLETEQVEFVLHVAPSRESPMRSKRHLSFDRAQLLQGARSRYGPAAPLTDFRQLLDRRVPFAFVGKPCDVAAVRNLACIDPRVDEYVRFTLAMVCGGASELGISTDFIAEHGVVEDDVTLFRYRGFGNPGPTRFETRTGAAFERTYNEFWLDESQWRLQFRCKICPDAIGEQADVVALDAWPGGAPTGEDEGFNVVLARTEKGLRLVNEAEAAGALRLLEPVSFRELDALQPHQVRKREALAARHAAFRAGTGIRLDFRGYRLVRTAARGGLRWSLSNFRGLLRRLRAGDNADGFAR
jgi:coenzyme F420 hydrogenase subunit beta